MLRRMKEFKDSGEVLNISYMLSALGNGKMNDFREDNS